VTIVEVTSDRSADRGDSDELTMRGDTTANFIPRGGGWWRWCAAINAHACRKVTGTIVNIA
jgi:hypothetical protein